MSARDAFYVPAGPGRFESTPFTAGPWSPDHQHAGPPSALMAREFERFEADPGQRLARIAVEILRPLPVAPVTVRARMVRPGRRVAMLEGVIEAGGQEVLLARAWRLVRAETPASEPRPAPPLPPPGTAEPGWPDMHQDGYLRALEGRMTSGEFGGREPGGLWSRCLVDLVAGEELTPFPRAAIIADSGNGVSQGVDYRRWIAINVEMTLSAHRDPEGEWIHLAADTRVGPDGTGRADGVLSDARGDFARAVQTLVVSPRA